jgi:hypothetical protein
MSKDLAILRDRAVALIKAGDYDNALKYCDIAIQNIESIKYEVEALNRLYLERLEQYKEAAAKRDNLYNGSNVNGVNAFSWSIQNPTHGFRWFFENSLHVPSTTPDNIRIINNLNKNLPLYLEEVKRADYFWDQYNKYYQDIMKLKGILNQAFYIYDTKAVVLRELRDEENALKYRDIAIDLNINALQEARNALGTINADNYYYNVTIETKHTVRGAFGIKLDPKYTYHTERRFNQDEYNKAKTSYQCQIESINTQITAKQAEKLKLKEQRKTHKLELERIKAEQLRNQKLEAERLQAEKLKLEKLEAEKIKAEQLRIQRLEAERLQAEKLKLEKLEAERIKAEQLRIQRLEAERLQAEKLKLEKLEAERIKAEQLRIQRLEAERLQAEKLKLEKLEAERIKAEQLELQRLEAERLQAEKLELERLEAERIKVEQLETQRLEVASDGEDIDISTKPSRLYDQTAVNVLGHNSYHNESDINYLDQI